MLRCCSASVNHQVTTKEDKTFTCKQSGGSTVCADSFRMLGKQRRVASEVCLSPSVGVKRSLVIKAKLPLLPDGKGRKSEEAEKESGRDKEKRREAGIVDEKRNKWKF